METYIIIAIFMVIGLAIGSFFLWKKFHKKTEKYTASKGHPDFPRGIPLTYMFAASTKLQCKKKGGFFVWSEKLPDGTCPSGLIPTLAGPKWPQRQCLGCLFYGAGGGTSTPNDNAQTIDTNFQNYLNAVG